MAQRVTFGRSEQWDGAGGKIRSPLVWSVKRVRGTRGCVGSAWVGFADNRSQFSAATGIGRFGLFLPALRRFPERLAVPHSVRHALSQLKDATGRNRACRPRLGSVVYCGLQAWNVATLRGSTRGVPRVRLLCVRRQCQLEVEPVSHYY
ncbi:hypothetical protein GGTG_12776 [Gaeumannomyces tritici R3-111a-1]|uniref:Uncharacterized protein n=1 Tax=Gaeumannomyces tritici (strain R3-111a-1) TaxID=644352 RepID=J3PGZ6_GAET3|nr:hypothetical protein GGTG_12776 [Gaeumannomyces tritici R3-111a-1]EJT69893.1 hypothetical protein GGTG_12776 [Gaeumannomyces tritici R3-111a-1]